MGSIHSAMSRGFAGWVASKKYPGDGSGDFAVRLSDLTARIVELGSLLSNLAAGHLGYRDKKRCCPS
jgi:hypothetical protein